jgi:hypothetical protein
MITKVYIPIVLSLLFTGIPSFALADLIILKNGNQLKVEKAWQEEDQICFILNDMNASIPQSKVVRIQNDREKPKTSERPDQPGRSSETDHRGNSNGGSLLDRLSLNTKPAASDPLQANLTKISPALHKNGIGKLKWGTRASSVSGLEPKQIDSGLKDVVEYVRPNDGLKLGDGELTSIVYAFWRDRLYTVTLWTRKLSNYQSLRQAVHNQFGQGSQPDPAVERYLWSDSESDMMLKFTNDEEYGFFWMRSKDIDRKFKLSRMSGHTSYLKWIKTRK